MSSGLFDMLAPRERRLIHGLVSGTVTDNQDPNNLGRVRVHLPSLGDDTVTPWARIATPMAGSQRGLYTLPEIGDEVLVGFEHGDPHYPYVLGALWNQNATPPESNASGTNDHRSLTSRSGHVIRLDDTAGQERIEIIDNSAQNSLVISSSDNTIEITAQGDVTIASTGGKVTIQGADVQITGDQSLSAEGKTSAQLSSNGQTTIKGSMVAIN